MVNIEIFKLFGKIFVNSDQAERDLDQVDNSAKKTGTTFDGLIQKIGGLTLGLGAAGLAAVGAFIGKGFMAAEDFKKSMNDVKAKTGLANNAFTKLDDTMKNIYAANFGEDFSDVGTSMAQVNQQTKAVGKELENLTKDGLLLRDTFDMEVNESIRSVDMMMKTFGDSGQEAYNLIAQGAQAGLDKNGNLLDSVNEYSVHFQQIGLDSEDMFNMFQNGAKAGVFDIDKLGDAVKEFGIRAKDGSKGTTEAFKELGLNSKNLTADFAAGGERGKKAFELVTDSISKMKDPVKQNQVGVALFGTMWEDMGSKAVKALTTTKGSIDKSKNALDKINKVKYDDIGSAIEGIKRQLEVGLFIPIGQKILPKVNELANIIQSKMPEIQAAFKGAFDVVVNILSGVVDNLDIIIPLLGGLLAATLAFKAVNTIMGIYKAWIAITKTQTIVQWALNSALFANPIGIVVAAIAGLVAAFVILWNTSDGFRNTVIGVWTAIKDFFVGIFNYLKDTFSSWGPVVLAVLAPFIGIPLIIYQNWDTIKAKLLAIWNWIKSTAQSIFNSIASFFVGIWDGIKNTANTVWNLIKLAIKIHIMAVKTIITTILNTIFSFISGIWNNIINVTSGVWNKVKSTISSIVNGIKDTISNVFNTIENTVTGIAKNALNWGKNIIMNIVDGIKSKIAAVKGMVEKVANIIKDFLGFSSPTKLGPGSDADRWTPNLIDMMEKGILKNIDKIRSASSEVADAMKLDSSMYINNLIGTSKLSTTNGYNNDKLSGAVNRNQSSSGDIYNINVVLDAKNAKDFANVVEFIEGLKVEAATRGSK